MTTYGRFASFRQSPIPQHRLGRFKTGSAPIVQFAPVLAGTTLDTADGRTEVTLAAADSDRPNPGRGGLLVWEEAWRALNDLPAVGSRPSDVDTCPAYTQAQVVHGTEVKVLVQNVADEVFEDQRTYEGRNMFNPTDLTTLAVGNLVTPGAGDDTNGYWKKTSTVSDAWGTVIEVDATYGLVVFQLTF